MTEIWDSLRCYWVEKDKLLAGSLPGRSTDVSALDQMTLLQQMGIRKIIDLTHPSETNGSLYLPALQSLNENTEHGIGYANVQVYDMGIPTSTQMHDILAHIADTNKAGHAVYVHCFGGLGRTGTVVGCYLIQQGMDPEAALQHIPELRKAAGLFNFPSPEALEQVEFVLNWR